MLQLKTTTWVAICLLLTAALGIQADPPPDPTVSGHPVGETFRDCAAVCPEMVGVPPGSFQMGSPSTEKDREDDEGPVHEVHIRYAFAVSKYPIARGEWKPFVKETGHENGSDCLLQPHPDTHPVICVSWQDAQDYAAWLSRKSGQHYRLLTEAEYEYINRAGSQTAYFWGDSADELPHYANDSRKDSTPVGFYKPNAFGLYDTTGNVWSWTEDCYHQNYNGAPTDGSAWDLAGDCADRVVRGGAWSNNPGRLRAAVRGAGGLRRASAIGFRLARTS
jgi:formylglycine-generating enzyme required for sulfatase activity